MEHIVCHINSSCRGKFGKLAPPPPPPLPIIGIAYETYTAKFDDDNGRELLVNCVFPRLVGATRAGGV